jgi:hypothetical protein
MRWKELFLVPDHRIESVAGATFSGFYYICAQISTGRIEGYYFYNTSQLYTQLTVQIPENYIRSHRTA